MDYKRFYELTEEYLNKMADGRITPDQLKEYFSPTNTSLPEENGVNNISRIFKRLCFHAQNEAMTTAIIDFIGNYQQIKQIAKNFNVADFLSTYHSADDVYKKYIEIFPEAPRRKKTSRQGPSKKLIYSRSMYSAAVLLSKFNSYEDFINQLLKYDEFAPEYIKYNVDGFGGALPSDFLKELDNRFDICKPDRHVKACLQVFCNIPTSITGDRLDYIVRKCCRELAANITNSGIRVTTFKLDKMLYLICSNVFYRQESKRNNTDSYRNEYINFIKGKEVL